MLEHAFLSKPVRKHKTHTKPAIHALGSFARGCVALAAERRVWNYTKKTAAERKSFARVRAAELGVTQSYIGKCLRIYDRFGEDFLLAIAGTDLDTVYRLTRNLTKVSDDGSSPSFKARTSNK